jgi:hypothetical protein
MECESVDWIQVAQDRVHWHVIVNTNDVLSVIQGRKFLTNWWTVSFLRSALLYGLRCEPLIIFAGSYICEK